MSIRLKLSLLFSGLVCLSTGLILAYNQKSNFDLIEARLYEKELPATVQNIQHSIEGTLKRYKAASIALANNPKILQWFAAGEPEADGSLWTEYAQTMIPLFDATNANFGSQASGRYYDEKGFNQAGTDYLPNWLDPFLDSAKPFEMVIDRNPVSNNQWTFYTNVRIQAGEKLGSIGFGINASDFAQYIEDLDLGERGLAYLVDLKGNITIHRNADLIADKSLYSLEGIRHHADQLLKTSDRSEDDIVIAEYHNGEETIIVSSAWLPLIDKFVIVELPRAQVFKDVYDAFMEGIGISILIIFIETLLIFIAMRFITTPIQRITDSIGSISAGQLATEVPYRDQKNELGTIAQAIETFRLSLQNKAHTEEERQYEQARLREESEQLRRDLARNFEEKVASLIGTVSQAINTLAQSAISMSQMSSEANEQSANVSVISQSTNVKIQEIASASLQLSTSSQQIGQEVSHSTQISETATETADASTQQIEVLQESADQIGAVVSLIQDIAEQTNLLALNATIEAARAGSAGKGFAVVASEVKNLANQTASATQDIERLVKTIQQNTHDTAQSMQSVQKTVKDISTISQSISSAVQEQSQSTSEISQNIELASQETAEVNQSINKVTAATENVGKLAEEVHTATSSLQETARTLEQEVSSFLKSMLTQKD